MRTAIITKIKGLSIQTQQNTFVLFTLFKLTSDEHKTLTKISTHKTSHNHSPNQRTLRTRRNKKTSKQPKQGKKKKRQFATPRSSVPANIQTPQWNVRYIKLPPGVTKGTYNLRSVPLNNSMVTKASTTSTPKVNTSTTTMVRKGKGREKQTSTISVLDTLQDEGEYSVEVEGEEFDDSDSDATELYEILANITGPEEETNLELEPEIDTPI